MFADNTSVFLSDTCYKKTL